jgi:intein/homing endonuclease
VTELTIKEAVAVLSQKFILEEGIAGVGYRLSDPRIVVYVEDEYTARRVPSKLLGYRVETVVTGRLYALSTMPLTRGATGRLVSGIEVSKTSRVRPIPGGVSIGSTLVTAGTLACVVYDSETGRPLMLSNRHIFWGPKGTAILQPGCLPPGSLVITNFGVKRIEEVKDGDVVLGNGKFIKVVKAMKRRHEGKIVEVKPHRFLSIYLTPEHPVLVIETSGFRNGQESERQLLSCKPKWKAAKDLNKHDFLLIPRIREYREADPITIVKYRYYCRRCGHAWRTYNKPSQPVCSMCRSKSEVEYKGCDIKVINVNDPDFGFLLGLFLADGAVTAGDRSIVISLHKDDKWFVEKTKRLFRRFFGRCSVHKRGNVVQITYNNSVVAKWFKRECYINGEKSIPSFAIYMDEYWIREFVEGLLVGDGKRGGKFGTLYTTSKTLAYQLAVLLAKIGVIPSIIISNKRRVRVKKGGKVINESEGYEVKCLPKYRRVYGYVLPDYIAIQIKEVQFHDYNGEVFNIETEDNTYSIPFIVHNSDDGGRYQDDVVGRVYRFIEIKPPPDLNVVDAALGEPVAGDILSNEVLDIGVVAGVEEARDGSVVCKSGRTTCYTCGRVVDTAASVKVYGYSTREGYALFEDQVIVEPAISKQGDSGSIAVNPETRRAVGLVFAGSDRVTVMNKATNVSRLLRASFTPISPRPALAPLQVALTLIATTAPLLFITAVVTSTPGATRFISGEHGTI